MTKKTTLLLAVLAFAVGCGGGGGSGSNGAWVGTWIADLSQAETCSTGDHTTPLQGAFPIAAGSADDEVVTMSTNGCNLTWVISGEVATLTPNQMCSVPGSVGGTWMPTFTAGSLSLAGTTLITVGDQGSASLVIAGSTVQCTFTQSGTFTKS